MVSIDWLKKAQPELVVDLFLYPTERGGKTLPASLGWGSPCTIQNERGSGWVGYDGWPLLLDGPISPGETLRVGYVFLSGKQAVDYLRSAAKFYIWEGRIVGEATIVL
ncbi:MAG: hypothetical protein WDM89_07570 [Rhizomicrobium sp.]